MADGFYQRRRGIYEHMESHWRDRLDWLDIAIHDWLTGHARAVMGHKEYPAGVWVGSVTTMWEKTGRNKKFPIRRLQRRVSRLEELGYLRRFIINYQNDAFVINKMVVFDAAQTRYRVNAEETRDWKRPKYDLDVDLTLARHQPDVSLTPVRRAADATPCSSGIDTEETGDKEDTEDTLERGETEGVPASPVVPLTSPTPTVQSSSPVTETKTKSKTKPVSVSELPAMLGDIREWDEERFGVPAERLRNCIVFQLDYSKDEWYQKKGINLSAMDTPGFVHKLHADTPPGWSPEKHKTYKRKDKFVPAEPSKYQPKESM